MYKYETCPEHGLQEVLRHESTGGSDPYDVAILRCGCRSIWLGPDEIDHCVTH